MRKRIVAFRVDASNEIGSGHLRRCLTLAQALKSRHAETHLISRDLPAEHHRLATKCGVETHALSSIVPNATRRQGQNVRQGYWRGTSWQDDAEATAAILATLGGADLLVIDHYGIDFRWERFVRSQAKRLLAVDDLADRAHEVDFLLDQNFYVDQHLRYRTYVAESTQCLFGPRYALLRPEFARAREAFARDERALERVGRVNVCFGGGDDSGETIKALEALRPWLHDGGLIVDIMVSSASPYRGVVQDWAKGYRTVIVHCSPDNVAELLAVSDIGVGASGSMIWERACVGLPSIAIAIAPNQQEPGEGAGRAGIHLFLGSSSEVSVDKLRAAIDFLLSNRTLRQGLADRAWQAVDGCGAERVARRVLAPEISLRRACLEDCNDVYRWRNAPINRQYAHDEREIAYEDHERWFKQILETPDRFLLIGSDQRGAVGVLRYDYQDGRWLTSIYLVPERNGEGLGTPLLIEGLEWLKSQCRDRSPMTVCAEIRPENTASEVVFERAGYKRRFSTFVAEVVPT